MYSNKENVNILTSLLVAHGIRHAVVCPGSRNAPIVHNLHTCPDIRCYPVTDERSAAFYALGMAQATGQPVVVCVTSGTALLNVLPAVAEAYYQQRPLVVVSADRPQQWIDQQAGQTLPQPDALGRFVRKAVTLVEPRDAEEHWYCNRLVNEALLECHGPVHINVPISEPLFDFSVASLPEERKIERVPADMSPMVHGDLIDSFMSARRPMLISGQPMNPLMDEAVQIVADDDSYVPDLVLYAGGSIVSKRLKRFLRRARETWVVNRTGEVTDTFMNLTRVFQGNPNAVAYEVSAMLEQQSHPFVARWQQLLARVAARVEDYEPPYSQMAAVRCLESHALTGPVHYANSTAIRLANIYARHHVWCNRGVNGIDGSVSTAAGCSCVTADQVLCITGDLSFFYDQNALWNSNLHGNLRILLLNNGGGAIFRSLPGLAASPARDTFVAACHGATAEGICLENGVAYRQVRQMGDLSGAIDWLLETDSEHPLLLEVLTEASADARALQAFHDSL